jgi:hypothetical protein
MRTSLLRDHICTRLVLTLAIPYRTPWYNDSAGQALVRHTCIIQWLGYPDVGVNILFAVTDKMYTVQAQHYKPEEENAQRGSG